MHGVHLREGILIPLNLTELAHEGSLVIFPLHGPINGLIDQQWVRGREDHIRCLQRVHPCA